MIFSPSFNSANKKHRSIIKHVFSSDCDKMFVSGLIQNDQHLESLFRVLMPLYFFLQLALSIVVF